MQPYKETLCGHRGTPLGAQPDTTLDPEMRKGCKFDRSGGKDNYYVDPYYEPEEGVSSVPARQYWIVNMEAVIAAFKQDQSGKVCLMKCPILIN